MHGPPGPFQRRALWPEAREALTGRDPVLDRCMAMIDGNPMVRIIDDPFVAIVSGFCHLIWPASQGEKQFMALLAANNNKLPTPSDIIEMGLPKLSEFIAVDEHARYLRDIAKAVAKNPALLSDLKSLSNDEVRDRLVEFKGVGPWMAGWVLMYHLARPNVVLLRDASLVRAIKKMYGLADLSEGDLRNLAAKWEPHVSAASWYIFMAAEKLIAAEKAAKAKDTLTAKSAKAAAKAAKAAAKATAAAAKETAKKAKAIRKRSSTTGKSKPGTAPA